MIARETGHVCRATLIRACFLCLAQCWIGYASATNNVYSETSHAIFGAFTGASITWGADYFWPEHRAFIGFGMAAGLGVLEEATSKSGYSALDAGANALGAAIGATLTDKFLLAPVINREVGHRPFLGVVLIKAF